MEPTSSNSFVLDGIRVFFKHTDADGSVHPYNFFEWTSYVREAFFQETVTNFKEVLERPIKMMTAKICASFLDDIHFGDYVEARLTVGRIKRVSFDMIVRFYDRVRSSLTCETTHTVVFVDSRTGRFADIPEEMKHVIASYAEPVSSQCEE